MKQDIVGGGSNRNGGGMIKPSRPRLVTNRVAAFSTLVDSRRRTISRSVRLLRIRGKVSIGLDNKTTILPVITEPKALLAVPLEASARTREVAKQSVISLYTTKGSQWR